MKFQLNPIHENSPTKPKIPSIKKLFADWCVSEIFEIVINGIFTAGGAVLLLLRFTSPDLRTFMNYIAFLLRGFGLAGMIRAWRSRYFDRHGVFYSTLVFGYGRVRRLMPNDDIRIQNDLQGIQAAIDDFNISRSKRNAEKAIKAIERFISSNVDNASVLGFIQSGAWVYRLREAAELHNITCDGLKRL